MISVKSYLPPEKRVRSKLQQVKDKHRSFTQTNKEGIPKDLNELKAIKYRDHAITFLNEYTDIDKSTTKKQYCKTHHISHNSLNAGLKQLGHETHIKRDVSRPIETIPDQNLKRPRTKKTLDKQTVKGGESYDFEDTFNKAIDSFSTNKCP